MDCGQSFPVPCDFCTEKFSLTRFVPKLMQFVIANVFVMLSDRSERPVFENVSIFALPFQVVCGKLRSFFRNVQTLDRNLLSCK